ncbi:ATP-binding protein [Thermopolyspora sp. NPDC052614]|uniref:ATP-binding protein n=1 Tax=Thermopolyspora sp. NPDC052614 TaxID=3155682 RepID=UPI00341EBFC3
MSAEYSPLIPPQDPTGAAADSGDGEDGGGRSVCWDLPAEAAIVRKVRAMTRSTLIGWRYPGDVHDVVLMVDELVANAVTHGRAPIRLCLRVTRCPSGRGVTLFGEVADASPEMPQVRETEHLGVHGRGLWIVRHLADDFGVRPSPYGKAVWFSLSSPA